MTVTPRLELRPESPPAPAPPCANCGLALMGPYCHACGQRDADHLSSLRAFLAHAAEVAVGYDSRLLRTARALFTRPGLLTAEYLAGHRVRYVSPLQAYLAAAAILFATTTWRPMVTYEPKPDRFHVGVATMSIHSSVTPADVAAARTRNETPEVFRERFVATTTQRLSTFLVLLVPLLALLVAGTFIRGGRPFAHHLLFALHWSAFYLVLLAAAHLMPSRAIHTTPAILLFFGVPTLYFVVALRRAYAIGWTGALVRGVPLFALYTWIILVWLNVVTWLTRLRP